MNFFFQAEDGIRDLTVTGVQTCALPISMTRHKFSIAASWHQELGSEQSSDEKLVARHSGGPNRLRLIHPGMRSEERRVGEEWRNWRVPDYLKKKRNGRTRAT